MIKIVRFNNGTFAVRKYCLLHFSYGYLDADVRDNYWWSLAYIHNSTLNTLEEAEERLEVYMKFKRALKDKGTPV